MQGKKGTSKYKFENFSGCKYGRLTLIKPETFIEDTRKTFRPRGEFLCECGVSKIIRIEHVVLGKIKSCGCLRLETTKNINLLPPGEASLNGLIRDYVRHAEQRNFEYSLSREEAENIFNKNCHYCGIPPYRIYKYCARMKKENGFIYNGIDRVDNNKGYIITNVVPSCWTCNNRKGSMSYQDFLNWISSIAKNLNLINNSKKLMPCSFRHQSI